MNNLPIVKKLEGIDTLFVNGKPFFAYSGELHNSSSSNLNYMNEMVWPNLKEMNMNSVIVPVYWEQIESIENNFNFTLLDGIISQARSNNMKLIILWFGLWKNGESMYVPGWMKKDQSKYYRAQKSSGELMNTISPLCDEAIEKDAYALSRVMERIRETDESENTVIMVQIENEIGLLGTDRDYSPEANKTFNSVIPAPVAKEFNKTGTWEEVFGLEAWEYFMSYYFASAVEKIAKKANEIYPIPYFANAWLKQYPWFAGSYPSGGPVKSMHKMWKLAAPTLFCLAPDIYVPNVAQAMEDYSYEGNPLVIPEVRKDAVTASYALHAFTKHNAICYSPFGIEDLGLSPEKIDKPPMSLMIALNIDPDAFEIEGSKEYLSRTYELLENINPLYLKHRGSDGLKSFLKGSEYDFGVVLNFKKFDLLVSYSPKEKNKPVSSGMIIELDENSFFVIGMMFSVTPKTKPGSKTKAEFIKIEEGEFKDGNWKPGRIYNGDEKMHLKLKDMPSGFYIELYEF